MAIRRDLLSLSCMALARPSTASAVALLPTPPATRRKSPSCWQSLRVLLSPFAHGEAGDAFEVGLQVGGGSRIAALEGD